MIGHQVLGASGVNLHVVEAGRADGPPILFIHGWSQSHLSWLKQLEGALAEEFRLAALDLRGHGMSDAPLAAEQYTDGDKWADDIAAVIDALSLDRPVLVGWSYGGFVIGDYVRRHGEDGIAGINLAGGAVALRPDIFDVLIGSAFIEHAPNAMQPDLATNIAAVCNLLRAFTVKPLAQDDFETALASAMVVKPEVRAFLLQRELDYTPVLASLSVPVLVAHGRADAVALPAMAEHVLANCRTAEASWYEGVGHAPFIEEPERFNRELAAFTRRARGGG